MADDGLALFVRYWHNSFCLVVPVSCLVIPVFQLEFLLLMDPSLDELD